MFVGCFLLIPIGRGVAEAQLSGRSHASAPSNHQPNLWVPLLVCLFCCLILTLFVYRLCIPKLNLKVTLHSDTHVALLLLFSLLQFVLYSALYLKKQEHRTYFYSRSDYCKVKKSSVICDLSGFMCLLLHFCWLVSEHGL